ncbi:MAG: class I SAM-dependent methyltransferase [Clostridia bacterium]|nr:class I SAM-dependent methyltransferase [Clostridia bacterium]
MQKKESMTALLSLFARAWHNERYAVRVLEDDVSRKLLSDEEYRTVGGHMANGISFFAPQFSGTNEQAIRLIATEYLCPSVLGRAVFSEQALRTAAKIGAKQYVLLGAGYDTFAYRQPAFAERLCIFELDRAKTVQDKIARLARAGITPPENVRYLAADFTVSGWEKVLYDNPAFDRAAPTFCSLLGLVYYLPTADFVRLLRTLQKLLCAGSSLVFDYPDENAFGETAGIRAQKQVMLASAAGEQMYGGYSLPTLTRLLSDCGFRVYEHLIPDEITAQFFALHNRANPETPLRAFDNVNYCLAVRKE